jgi:gluconokinase
MQGLIFLPYLNGERAPLWDERACGAFLGIRSFHTKAFFLRAVVEGICYAMNQVLETVESSVENISQLHVGGGFIHSETWMKILSDISGKELCVNETEDASAVGAALIGMKSLKMIEDYTALQPADPFRLKPDPGRKAVYEKYYQVFKKGYGLLKASMHSLHDISA